jgi:DNA-3-methyladenine glycosylase
MDFLNTTVDIAAPLLLGCFLERFIDGTFLKVRIVEVEAYDQTDAASHSYNGRTPRTDIMFGAPGYMYVYFVYGMHYCSNIVVGPEGYGAAVLIRAVEVINGQDIISKRRHKNGFEATNGPAKLCQALGIDNLFNGHDLTKKPLILTKASLKKDERIVQTTRIGISKSKDVPWRFYIKGNPYVSAL